jgi:hypothetical protein
LRSPLQVPRHWVPIGFQSGSGSGSMGGHDKPLQQSGLIGMADISPATLRGKAASDCFALINSGSVRAPWRKSSTLLVFCQSPGMLEMSSFMVDSSARGCYHSPMRHTSLVSPTKE